MFNLFQNNDVIKRQRQKQLANHFTLTQPHEERGSISLAQFGAAFLKIIMFCSFIASGFFLPYDGLRQVLTIATLAVLGFFVIRFKSIFTERLFVAQFNLTDETLDENTHIQAEKQYSENFTKVIVLWLFCLVVVTAGGYFGAKKFVAASIVKYVESKELKQNYDAASLTYNTAVSEGKSSAFLKPLQKEMFKAETKIKLDKEAVKAQNEVLENGSQTELYGYGAAAAAIEFLVGLILFQLLYFIEKKQFEEHKADRVKNPKNGAFNGESTTKAANTEGGQSKQTEKLDNQIKSMFSKVGEQSNLIFQLQEELATYKEKSRTVIQGLKTENEALRKAQKPFKQEKQAVSDDEFLKNELAQIAKNPPINGTATAGKS